MMRLSCLLAICAVLVPHAYAKRQEPKAAGINVNANKESSMLLQAGSGDKAGEENAIAKATSGSYLCDKDLLVEYKGYTQSGEGANLQWVEEQFIYHKEEWAARKNVMLFVKTEASTGCTKTYTAECEKGHMVVTAVCNGQTKQRTRGLLINRDTSCLIGDTVAVYDPGRAGEDKKPNVLLQTPAEGVPGYNAQVIVKATEVNLCHKNLVFTFPVPESERRYKEELTRTIEIHPGWHYDHSSADAMPLYTKKEQNCEKTYFPNCHLGRLEVKNSCMPHKLGLRCLNCLAARFGRATSLKQGETILVHGQGLLLGGDIVLSDSGNVLTTTAIRPLLHVFAEQRPLPLSPQRSPIQIPLEEEHDNGQVLLPVSPKRNPIQIPLVEEQGYGHVLLPASPKRTPIQIPLEEEQDNRHAVLGGDDEAVLGGDDEAAPVTLGAADDDEDADSEGTEYVNNAGVVHEDADIDVYDSEDDVQVYVDSEDEMTQEEIDEENEMIRAQGGIVYTPPVSQFDKLKKMLVGQERPDSFKLRVQATNHRGQNLDGAVAYVFAGANDRAPLVGRSNPTGADGYTTVMCPKIDAYIKVIHKDINDVWERPFDLEGNCMGTTVGCEIGATLNDRRAET